MSHPLLFVLREVTMAGIRCFVAVELDDTAREALNRTQEKLKPQSPPRAVRWVNPETIHLTLQFLGDAPPGQVEVLGQAIRSACAGLPGFRMDLEGLGVFPNARRPRIVWVGVSEPSGVLLKIQARVGEALTPLGFPPEEREFSPHLTIGRVNRDVPPRDLVSLGDLIGREGVARLATVAVDHVCLMKSDLRPQGPVYTPLAVVPLGA